MKKQICIAAVLGMVLLGIAGPVFAMGPEDGPGGPGPMDGKKMEAHAQEMDKSLGLTEEQRTSMKALRTEMRTRQEALRTELKAKHEALRQELDSANADRGKAEAIAKEINVLQAKMADERLDQVFKIKAILTPEQFQKLQAFHEKNKGKFKEHRQKMKKERSGKE